MIKRILITMCVIFFTSSLSYGQQFQERLKYPAGLNSAKDKLEYCYIAQEKLRKEHNKKGKDFKEGKITGPAWRTYLRNRFRPKSDAITNDMLKAKEELKKSIKYEVNLDDLEKNPVITP